MSAEPAVNARGRSSPETANPGQRTRVPTKHPDSWVVSRPHARSLASMYCNNSFGSNSPGQGACYLFPRDDALSQNRAKPRRPKVPPRTTSSGATRLQTFGFRSATVRSPVAEDASDFGFRQPPCATSPFRRFPQERPLRASAWSAGRNLRLTIPLPRTIRGPKLGRWRQPRNQCSPSRCASWSSFPCGGAISAGSVVLWGQIGRWQARAGTNDSNDPVRRATRRKFRWLMKSRWTS